MDRRGVAETGGEHGAAGAPGMAGEAAEARVLWILWGAMMWCVALYVLIGFFLRPGGDSGIKATPPAMLNVIAAGAVFLAATSIALRGVLARSTSYRNYSIVRWALAEAIAIAGLALALLGARTNVFVVFIGVSILLLLVHRPSADARREYARLRGEGEAGAAGAPGASGLS